MHIGMGAFFQNLEPDVTDGEVVRRQLDLVDRAEPAGFDSMWTAEHHFTRYHMMPNPLQFLTWVAGRTQRLRLGTMVVVLPWHDPVRVAEEVAWLDQASGGRLLLGLGRGLGSVEFTGFRLEMGESRRRFIEYAGALSAALDGGTIAADGELYRQPATAIRPPATTTFRGRTYASAVSPESARIMADLGYGLMLIAQKPWATTLEETQAYRELFVDINGYEPPRPILVNFTAVDRDPGRAAELAERRTLAYAHSTVEHYQFTDARLETIEGYEYYAGLRRNIEKKGVDNFARFLAGLQIGGTPDEVVDQTVERVRALDAGGVINVLTFGGMTAAEAETNFATYASDVLPRLQAIDTDRDVAGAGSVAVGAA